MIGNNVNYEMNAYKMPQLPSSLAKTDLGNSSKSSCIIYHKTGMDLKIFCFGELELIPSVLTLKHLDVYILFASIVPMT